MLEINVKDYRELSFEMELSGISPDQLEGRLRMIVDNIEYGIPAKITETEITVNIPPLKRLIQRPLDEGETFPARLDVFGEGHYLKPWDGEFKVNNPVIVEAKIKEDSQPEIKVSVTEIGSKPKAITEKKKITKQPDIKTESKTVKKTTRPPKKKPLFENKEQFKKNLTRDHVIDWIGKNATKNPQIQEMLYEQAAVQAGSSKPYKILVALTEVIKKFKYRS